MSLFIDEKEIDNFHFVGVLGIGMSAIAQYLAKDCVVGGSDRSLGGNPANIEDEKILKNQGISLFLQDGSGISEKTQAVVVSTAIEGDNLDIKKSERTENPRFSPLPSAFCDSKKMLFDFGHGNQRKVVRFGYDFSYSGFFRILSVVYRRRKFALSKKKRTFGERFLRRDLPDFKRKNKKPRDFGI